MDRTLNMSTDDRLARLEKIATLGAATNDDLVALVVAARSMASATAAMVCGVSHDPLLALDRLRELVEPMGSSVDSSLTDIVRTELERLMTEVEIAVTHATRVAL